MAAASKTHVLERVYKTIDSRRDEDTRKSYTALLLTEGTGSIAKKLMEESTEAIIEAIGRDRNGLVRESADVLYHLLVLWADGGVKPADVWREMERREGVSGIAEKKARPKRQAKR
jgi:phosphoribosyl-ATP pyrophosphohydrolase